MGAGFRTFASGEVLTAANVQDYLMDQSVMVFAGTAERGSALPSPEIGMTAYSTATGMQVYNGTDWVSIAPMTKVVAFTANGTWTVPAGVTYAIAHIRGAGGGIGLRDRAAPATPAGNGGSSSVAFAGGTVSATGGAALNADVQGSGQGILNNCVAGNANSGLGAFSPTQYGDATTGGSGQYVAIEGTYIVAGGDVTPAASITVTVGAGGTAGSGTGTVGAAGGSGYVWIEYQE